MAYFPNASAGEVLDEQCADCPLGRGWNDPRQQDLFDVEREPKPCPVAFVQLHYNYAQVRGVGCDATADYLQTIDTPEFEEYRDGITYPKAEQQLETAIDWLRSDHLRDAMNWLIDDNGECQVRKLLVECREEGRR